jgi:hypothetical protein
VSGIEQQACCCDKLHPCCASWDVEERCVFGGVNDCTDNPGSFQTEVFTLRQYEASRCFETEEQCREYYFDKPNLDVIFDDTVFCPNETTIPFDKLPEDFCKNPNCKKPCRTYVCDECGPVSNGCELIPCGQECEEPPTCDKEECCNPPPPRYCCCVTVVNGDSVDAVCIVLPEGESCADIQNGIAESTLPEGGIASECPDDCTKYYAVRRYKTCKTGKCQSCIDGCGAQAECCNTWVTEVSSTYRCVGTYTDGNGDIQICPDGIGLDFNEQPPPEMFDVSQQYAKRCSEVRFCWVTSICGDIVSGVHESDCGAEFPVEIPYENPVFPCIESLSCPPLGQVNIPIIPSPVPLNQANYFCQTLSVPNSDPNLPPQPPSYWSAARFGDCDCSGNTSSPLNNNAALADNLCACCGCVEQPWGCEPGGGGGNSPGNPAGGWGNNNPGNSSDDTEDFPGNPVPNGVYCFEVANCDQCRGLECVPGVQFFCSSTHCPSQACCPDRPCPPLCPPCGEGCVNGFAGCCTKNGGCRGFLCRCILQNQGPCGCYDGGVAGNLQYLFSMENKTPEKNLTKGYVYDKNGNLIVNDIFLFGYGASFL